MRAGPIVFGYYTGDKPNDQAENWHINIGPVGFEWDINADGSWAGMQLQLGPGPGFSVGSSPLDTENDPVMSSPNYSSDPGPVCPAQQ